MNLKVNNEKRDPSSYSDIELKLLYADNQGKRKRKYLLIFGFYLHSLSFPRIEKEKQKGNFKNLDFLMLIKLMMKRGEKVENCLAKVKKRISGKERREILWECKRKKNILGRSE